MKKDKRSFKIPFGTIPTIVSQKIGDGIQRGDKTPKPKENKRNIPGFKTGTGHSIDLEFLMYGFNIVELVIKYGFDILDTRLVTGKNDEVGMINLDLSAFRNTIDTFIRRIHRGIEAEYRLHDDLKFLRESYTIIQAARDGILLKKTYKIDRSENGYETKVFYDIPMSPEDVLKLLEEYRRMLDYMTKEKIKNYIGLGMNAIGALGMLKNEKAKSEEDKGSFSILSLGSLILAGTNLAKRFLPREELDLARELDNASRRREWDLLGYEQISTKAEIDTINDITRFSVQAKNAMDKVENQDFVIDATLNIIIALLTGIYLKNKIKIKENGKVDGQSIASAIVDLANTKGYLGNIVSLASRIAEGKERAEKFKDIEKQVEEIMRQMGEKVYPLEGASCSFDSFQISDFEGKFYPTTNYETNEIEYGTSLIIPEFSIKRGEVVLLSGKSGSGKSTFLRFLKRGDINNRKAIKLDNGEVVDNLGNEYSAFRPTTDLGTETTILNQITGKESISELTDEERARLSKIIQEFKLYKEDDSSDTPEHLIPSLVADFLSKMSEKNFMQYSTGQQRRLALSKIFFRIKDATSVMIVDEPVGNVEEELIRTQLELIVRYAKENNIMLILVTHRIDLAEDLVTKRYHISSDGKMKQVPVKTPEILSEEILNR